MATLHTVCPLDCPDRCSLEVRVEDGRVAAIDGSRVNPVTQGFICSKVRAYPKRLYGPDRLLHPMRRVGGKGEGRFERTSWDDALDEVARRLEAVRGEHGGEAILPFAYGGSNGLVSQGSADEWLFRRLGASRLARTVCAAQTGAAAAALYGKMASVDFPDFEQARFVLLWGGNPKASNVHLMPYLKRAREAGARIALVDPRRVLGPEWVDWHLAVRPGTDVALALAMIGHLERTGSIDRTFLAEHTSGWEALLARAREWTLERADPTTGVPAADVAAVAESYAAADPALVRCGWGVERNRNGEAAVAAILALPAVAGKFGRPGGGYALSASEAYAVDGDHLAGAPEPQTRLVNMSRLGRALLGDADPPVRALFVYDANPVVTLPDQERVRLGLLREDLFTVVFDQVRTDTAAFADVLLPATTFLEHAELSTSYGTYAVMLGEPVVPPVGEARPNAEVFAELARRLGIEAPPQGDALLARALAAIGRPLAGESGVDGASRLARLRREGVLRFDFPGERPVQFVTALPGTPDQKAHLWADELGEDPYRFLPDPADPAYPLALISPSTDKSICSTLGEYGFREAWAELHPDDAAARGLAAGQLVRVFNGLGELVVPLRLSDALRRGVVYVPKGTWNRHSRNGRAGTALVPDDVSPISGGARFNDARVEVGPA
jgi:anaerobic selenocysteine-containing dehydrogenase